MANPLFCKTHQILWFKKGKMKGFAHPILDAEGEPTGEWCNQPQKEKSEAPEEETIESQMTKEDWAERVRITRKSIERQKALELAIEYFRGVESVERSAVLILAKTFEIYFDTGNVPSILPEAPKPKSKPADESVSDNIPKETKEAPETRTPIDWGWLKVNLGILQEGKVAGWSNANVASYLETLTGQKAKSIMEAVNRLTPAQAEAFIKRVNEAVQKSESQVKLKEVS